jgi:hypothetical protein
MWAGALFEEGRGRLLQWVGKIRIYWRGLDELQKIRL